VDKIRAGGHLIGNHLYTHDIMTLGNYATAYGAKPGSASCLTTPKMKSDFEYAVMQNHREWEKAGYTMKHLRFPGDGRLIQCLKDAAAALGYRVHTPWQYELAPSKFFAVPTSYWFGYVKANIGVKVDANPPNKNYHWVLYGDQPVPNAGAVVLAHDAHYAFKDEWGHKIELLREWVRVVRSKGFEFAILQADGKCPKEI